MPPLPRPIRKVGAPLAVIITLGTLAGLILILLTAVNPAGTALGFVLSTIAMSVVLLCYLWLDRWEPEPPRLLVLAFLWGASIAIVVSVLLEAYIESAINPGQEETSFFTVAVVAPADPLRVTSPVAKPVTGSENTTSNTTGEPVVGSSCDAP